jgi:hypothetical protein
MDTHIHTFYPLMMDLLVCESIDVRQALKNVLLRIGKMRGIY